MKFSRNGSGEPDRQRGLTVLAKIDEILAWQASTEQQRESRFVELGRYLCEARAGQYWRLENLRSFDDFLDKKFPNSRRKAYYLMAIYDRVPKQARDRIEKVGWTKAADLARVARAEGEKFDSEAWIEKAERLPKEQFKYSVESYLAKKETEPWDNVSFKLYRSQMPVIDQALATAALMLGTDKSRGYCLEMICADFLAGVQMDGASPKTLLLSLYRLYQFLSPENQQKFLEKVT